MSSRAVLAKRQQGATTVKAGIQGSLGTAANANMRRPPGQSMASQVAFSQAQMQQQQQQQGFNLQQQQQMNQPQRRVGQQRPTQQISPQLTQQQQYNAYYGGGQQPQPQQQPHGPLKLSVSDAFALTTIRLGSAEEKIMQLQEQIQDMITQGFGMVEGEDGGVDEEGNPRPRRPTAATIPEGAQIVDKAAFDNMTKKLDASDKINKESQLNMQKLMKDMQQLRQENMQFKQAITTISNTLNKHINDTGKKFDETDGALTQLETAINSLQSYEQPMLLEGNENTLDNFSGMGMPSLIGEGSVHDPNMFSESNPLTMTTNMSTSHNDVAVGNGQSPQETILLPYSAEMPQQAASAPAQQQPKPSAAEPKKRPAPINQINL